MLVRNFIPHLLNSFLKLLLNKFINNAALCVCVCVCVCVRARARARLAGTEVWMMEVPQLQTLPPSVKDHTKIRNTAVKLI
jgi:hypothetical protein